MKFISYLNRTIEYSFYVLFILIPLVFSGAPSELFEFPKMWLTFGITILIGTAWISSMILQKQFRIQRTPLDIPIMLFLLSQIISTIFSQDVHVSLWGYYSRFNGGLLSIIAYIFLYYAFVSNLSKNHVFNILKISLFSGLLVAIWGLPSHFGWDPTCYVFRGNFDTSCWTEAFKPTIRIFSTLGQPAWLAAYMSILIPISIAYFIKNYELRIKNQGDVKKSLTSYFLLLTSLLFYACLTYTDTRGGFIGFWVANLFFWAILFLLSFRAEQSGAEESPKNNSLKRSLHSPIGSVGMTTRYFLIFNLLFLSFNFFQGIPISQVSKFTLPELIKSPTSSNQTVTTPQVSAGALGGTDSGKIRLLVWKGAIDAWKDHPLIGTGVETFAFAYYKYRPIEHNLTSEWDYLYNKAHNEYLNYLATTGIFGLGSYLAIIIWFLFGTCKWLMANSKWPIANGNDKNDHKLYAISDKQKSYMLIVGLLAGYTSILISNFFGFSVVIINLYFFLIPGLVFILGDFLNPEKSFSFPTKEFRGEKIKTFQWVLIGVLLLTSGFLLLNLTSYWTADLSYASGSNLDKAGSYQEALPPLQIAVNAKPHEPVYKDELSINLGTLAAALYLQKDASSAAQFSATAISLSDYVTTTHPKDVVFWKNRVRLFYALAQGDQTHEKIYLQKALESIQNARSLAPRDAKISYNLGVLKGQVEGPKKGIEVLENTVRLKPDYRDAYFALGLFYHELAVDENGFVTDPALQKKAINAYQYILKHIDPQDKQVQESLKNWQ